MIYIGVRPFKKVKHHCPRGMDIEAPHLHHILLKYLGVISLYQIYNWTLLFRCRSFISASELLRLYVGLIRPCLEYWSHVWGGCPFPRILDMVEAKAFRLIDGARLTSTLDSLSIRRRVASLTIFYIIYFGHCSHELMYIIPPPLPGPRSTRQAASSHNLCEAV